MGAGLSSGAVLLFAHTGITIGAAVLLNGLVGGHLGSATAPKFEPSEKARGKLHIPETWFVSLGRRIDLRVLLVASLLPDIIDKPAGRLLYGTWVLRLSSHTLVFLLVVVLASVGLYLSRYRKLGLALGFGVLMHLALDEMWLSPHTLYWPAYGLSFPAVYVADWKGEILHDLSTSPEIYVPELVGIAILAYSTWLLVHRSRVFEFIRHGQV